MTEPVLGIDIAKLKFNVCLIHKGGKLKHKLFLNTAAGFEHLRDWLSRQGVQCVHACLEATGTDGDSLSLSFSMGRVTPRASSTRLPSKPSPRADSLARRQTVLTLS